METLEKIKTLTDELTVDVTKFFKSGNKSAGTRARKTAQELKSLLQQFRGEILDSRKTELARVAAVDDLVVSDSLAALIIAQISENSGLAPVFDDLFDAEGATLNVRHVSEYVAVGKSVTFAELVAHARNYGESAIGYRVANAKSSDGSTGVILNPSKTMEFIPAEGDGLVVIGNL